MNLRAANPWIESVVTPRNVCLTTHDQSSQICQTRIYGTSNHDPLNCGTADNDELGLGIEMRFLAIDSAFGFEPGIPAHRHHSSCDPSFLSPNVSSRQFSVFDFDSTTACSSRDSPGPEQRDVTNAIPAVAIWSNTCC